MSDIFGLTDFHFIRPLWLLMLIPSVAISIMFLRQQGTLKQWKKFISPHLLDHLIVGTEQRKRIRPIHTLLIFCIVTCIALAGPTWGREASPFTEDTASLVIALDLSVSMNAIDIQPTRLQRAKQKISELLALRIGARTGLIAYAGSAHMVLPLTDDPHILETYLNSLSPDMMPVVGKDPSSALALAREMVKKEESPGTILFITDGISREHLPSFVEHSQSSHLKVLALGIGTAKGSPILIKKNEYLKDDSGMTVISVLDKQGLAALSQEAGAYVTTVTLDDTDVQRINHRIENHLKAMQSENENMKWKDSGYYVVILSVLLSLFWFRRGWTIQWTALFLIAATVLQPSTAVAGDLEIKNLFLTPDQQGRYYFESENYEEAAKRFNDPLWKGISFYMNENFEAAINELVKVNTPRGYFNLANAYAHYENYEQAVKSYDIALNLKPDYGEARHNRDLVQALIEIKEEEEDDQEQQGDPSLEADEIKFDEKGKKGKKGEVEQSTFSEEQIAEMWMRNIQTSPAEFLRRKFAIQVQEDTP